MPDKIHPNLEALDPNNLVYAGPVAGVFFAKPDLLVLHPGDPVVLTPEPENPYDPSAIRVDHNGNKLGYIPKLDTHLIHNAQGELVSYIYTLNPESKKNSITIVVSPVKKLSPVQ